MISDMHCMQTCSIHIKHQFEQKYKAESCKQNRVNVKLLSVLCMYNTKKTNTIIYKYNEMIPHYDDVLIFLC